MIKKIKTNIFRALLIFTTLLALLYNLSALNDFYYYTVKLKLSNHVSLFFSDYYKNTRSETLARLRNLPHVYLDQNDLPTFNININRASLSTLNSSLPLSGTQYQPVTLDHKDKIYEAELRYRGDNSFHWFNLKKSYKIKLLNKEKINNSRYLQLINIKTASFFAEYAGNQLAQNMGLLVAQEEFVRLYLNNQYQGVYLSVQRIIDDDFLESNDKLVGDIYQGENAFSDRIVDLPRNLFQNPFVWDKKLSTDPNKNKYSQNLQNLIRATMDFNQNQQNFETLEAQLDLKYWQKFLAWQSITQATHLDNVHNNVLYFDPVYEEFIPIPWDSFSFLNYFNSPNIASNDLIRTLYKNPVFVHQKNQFIWDFLQNQKVIDQLLDQIKDQKDVMQKAINQDQYKAEIPNIRIIINNSEYEKHFQDLLDLISQSNKLVKLLKNANTKFTSQVVSPGVQRLNLFPDGYSPVKINHLKLNPECQNLNPTIYADLNLNQVLDKTDSSTPQTLYPGLTPSNKKGLKGMILNPIALDYTFFLKLPSYCQIEKVELTNIVSDQAFLAKKLNPSESPSPSTYSIHPWILNKN